MSAKEVTELRQSGNLKEAHSMGKQLLNTDSENIWNKRAMSWVYYEYLKKYSSLDTRLEFVKTLQNLNDLKLGEDEKMVFDNSARQIGKLVYAIQAQKTVDYQVLDELFGLVKDFHFTKPSKGYSFLYGAFLKVNKTWPGYTEFVRCWGVENFLSEDYSKTEYRGRSITSLVEKAFVAYSNNLLTGEPELFGSGTMINHEAIKIFLPKLDKIITDHPEYQYPAYYKVKLMLAIGETENISSFLLPFAKRKKNDYWVWELLGDVLKKDKEEQFACYCKALSLKTQDKFLGKLRQKFALLLLEKEMYNEAKTEVMRVVLNNEIENWKIPKKLTILMEQDWFRTAESRKDNHTLYSTYLNKAEEILLYDTPEETVVVEFVNKDKQVLNFVKDKSKHGFFNYNGHLNNPKVGEAYTVRLTKVGDEGFYKILTAKKTDSDSSAIRTFKGTLRLVKSFGFVDDVFLDAKLIDNFGIKDGDEVTGKAILSYNKKKDNWGWKALDTTS